MAWTNPATAVSGQTALTASFWNEQVRDNLNMLAGPFAAWTTYNTPTQSGWSLGNGTIAARYLRIGSLCIYAGTITFGSTTSISGTFRVGLPFSGNIRNHIGSAILTDTGVALYHGFCIVENSVDANLLAFLRSGGSSSAAYVNATTPFTWGNTDVLTWNITYEIAPT